MKKSFLIFVIGLMVISSSLWGQTTNVTISAQSQWESTGVTITPEMTVTIEATGEWCGAPWSCYGPEGTGGIAPGAFLAPGLSSGGLVGKAGNNAPFLVGSLCSFNGQDHGTGTLYLAFNDDLTGYYNNSGTLDVTITTTEEQGGIELVGQYTDKAASDLKIRGDFAYVTDLSAKQLYILNITDPTTPTLVGSYTSPHSEATMVSLIDQYAYVTVGWSGFEVVDISNPAIPTKVGPTHDTPGYTKDIEFANGYAFVAARESGVRVYDVSDPANPVYVTTYSTSAWATSMAIYGNYLYIGIEHSPNGFEVFDISNPAVQNRVGTISGTNSVFGIATDGDYVYHSGQWENTFNIVDVSNPSNPVRLGTGFPTHGDPWGIAVVGNLAFLGERSYGLQVVDISDKTNSVLLDEYDTGGDPLWGIQVEGDYVYLADGPGGVKVFSATGTPPPPEGGDILVYATSEITYGYTSIYFDDDLPLILADAGFSATVTDRIATPVITSALLDGYDQLWILSTDPYSGSGCFSSAEISAILDFRNACKGILIMPDDGPPGHDYTGDANQISSPLGVTFSGQYNYGAFAQPFEPNFSPHPLFSGVQNIVCTENSSILNVNNPAEVVATYQGNNMIAVLDDGKGRVVFDVSFVRLWDGDINTGYVPMVTVGNTPQYVRNIANWLGGSGHQPEITFTIYDSEGLSPNALVRAFAQTPGSDVIADYHGYTDGFGRVTFPIEEGSAVMLNVSPENHWNEWASFDYITPRNIDVHATVQLPANAENRVQQLTIPGPNPTAFLEAVIFACALPPELPWFIDIFPTFALSYDEDFLVFLENAAVSQGGQWVINFATVAYAHSLCYHMVGEPVVTFVSSAAPTASAAATKMHSGLLPLLVVPTNILYSAWYGVSNFMTNLGYIGMVEGQSISGYCDMDLLVIDAEGNRVGSVYSDENEFVIDMNEITGAQYTGHCSHPNQIYMPTNNQVHKLVVNPRSTGQYTIGFSVLEAGILRSYQVSEVFEDLSPIELSLKGFDLSNGPTAIAGSDTTIESGQGIVLDGTQSFDVDGQIVGYRWCEGSQVLSTNASFSTILPEGIHQIALIVTDDDSITAIAQQTIIVGSGEPDFGFFSIEVFDTLTDREVDGASIEYNGTCSGSATASPLGTALLSLIPGEYDLVVSHPDYYCDSFSVQISVNQTASKQVFLAQRFGMIKGLVRDTTANMNLNGAVISYSGPESGQVLSDSSGSFEVKYLTPGIYILACDKDCYLSLADSVIIAEGQSSILAFDSYKVGSISGSVCDLNACLSGTSVDIFDSDGVLYDTRVTDESGNYFGNDIPIGDYSITLVSPLGYQTILEIKEVTIACDPVVCDFELTQLEITPEQRGRGYWMHQVNALLSGKGNPQETYEGMGEYMELIRTHFNQHGLNPVNVFEVVLTDDCDQRLEALRTTISPKAKATMNEKARAHLTALLLNMVSGKIAQWHLISDDSLNVSQAITYCNSLITDGNPDNDEAAKDIAEMINEGQIVPAGMIDPSTANIAYKQNDTEQLPTEFSLSQNYPNPFNPSTEISFALPSASDVKLEVFNIMGQRVATLLDQHLEAGNHNVIWDGSQVASGIYFYRLDAGEFTKTRKMVLLK